MRTRTVPQTFWSVNPVIGKGKNLRIIAAIFIAFCIILIFTMVPFMQSAFGTGKLRSGWLGLAFAFGTALFILEDLRKRIIKWYPGSYLAQIAW